MPGNCFTHQLTEPQAAHSDVLGNLYPACYLPVCVRLAVVTLGQGGQSLA